MIPVKLFEHTSKVIFEEKRHIYTIDGVKYESATRFLKQYCQPFDSEFFSKKIAKKEGVSQAEILARWDEERDMSTVRGNGVHSYIELKQRGFDVRPPNKIIIRQYGQLQKFLSDNDIIPLFNEFKTYNPVLKIAGTMDALYWSKREGKFVILDWKTNKKLEEENPYKKFCKYPFKNIPDTDLGHYNIQINIYRYMIGQVVGEDMMSENNYVVYFPHKGDMKIFPVKDLQKEMKIIANFS